MTKSIIYLLIFIFSVSELFCQEYKDKVRIVSYNVENLFDTVNNTLTRDGEFTEKGEKHWTDYKYKQKLINTYKVITAIGEGEMPSIICLQEVENIKVLNDLINTTPLLKYKYKIVHYDSPDRRGIDVAILYKPDDFKPIHSNPIRIIFPYDTNKTTRDILYVKGFLNDKDTIHIFNNHWPSRWGGQKKSENKRIHAAKVLKHYTDSLLSINSNSKIIIAGDLNDTPEDISVKETLKALNPHKDYSNNKLYNLTTKSEFSGTIKYQGKWSIFDQIIVSGGLISGKEVFTTFSSAKVFNTDFLLEDDKKYLGKKPYRTYVGYKYNSGYSDHLPVYLDIFID